MKKLINFVLAFLVLLLFSTAKAQTYLPGNIILTDGTRIGALILLNDDSPWSNQRAIWAKDSAAVAADPKTKAKKYRFDEMKQYVAGNRVFEKIHYVDMENLQVKSLGANDHMMERLSKGRINSYRYYQYPADVEAYFATEEEIRRIQQEKKDALIRGYKILSQKDNDDKLRDAFDYDLQKYFEDTPDVLKKYQAGEYGNEPIVVKKGFAAKLVAMAKKVAFKQKEAEAIIAAFNEYNEKNPVKK